MLLVGCDSKKQIDCNPDDFEEIGCPDVEIAKLSDLVEGVPVDFDYPVEGLECFLVKLGDAAEGGVGPNQDVVAFSYICTHMGCSLKGNYNHDHKLLGPCRCHFTTFSLRRNGGVILGQATQDLVRVELSIDGDNVIATGLSGVLYGEIDNRCCNDAQPAGNA